MRKVLGFGLVCFSLLVGPGGPGALQAGQSLGDIAARERAKREKERAAKPPRVFTQEDLDKLEGAGRPNSAAASPAGSSAPAPETPPPSSGNEGQPSEGSEETSGSTLGGGREKNLGADDAWRDRHREALAGVESARQNQGSADAEVERLKQDLNPMSTTFSNDPYVILPLQAKLTEAQARAAEAQKAVEAAQKVVDDLVNEARRNGVYLQ